jgi:hypothetical protein
MASPKPKFNPGDCVIYRMTKQSMRPGRRAKAVWPTPNGDHYVYNVDKLWVVLGTQEDCKLRLRTRRGKLRLIDADDPNLRRAHWWEKLLYRGRFPQLAPDLSDTNPTRSSDIRRVDKSASGV